MSNRLSLVVALVAVVLSGTARTARASDVVEAEELIRQANDFRRRGEDQKALPLLKQAYEAARSPRTAAQFGLAELALGYWVEAEGHLEEALTVGARHPFVDKNRGALESALKTARAHVAELSIEGPIGAEARVNGQTVGTLPLPRPLRVSEGRLEVQVRVPGRDPVTRTLYVAGGANQRLPFDGAVTSNASTDTPAVVVPPSASDTPGAGWRRVLPIVLAGGGLVAAVVGVWQHVAWRNTQANFDGIAACGEDAPMRGADARCRGLYDSLDGERTRAYFGYGLAAALSAGAGVLFLLNRSAAAGQEAVAPGPGSVGLSYRVRF